MVDASSTSQTNAPRSTQSRLSVRILSVGIILFMLVAVGELSARAFWRWSYGFGMFSSRDDATVFYPELRGPLRLSPNRTDTILDVLLLGGSTLNRGWGAVEPALQERLTLLTNRPVRIFNLAKPAHTSRDSYYKYRSLEHVRFDVVVLYDGFNDVRMNNAPPQVFRDDYSHSLYYQLASDILDRHRLRPFALPYTIAHVTDQLVELWNVRSGHPSRLSKDQLPSGWTAYGSVIRTARPYRRNVEAVLDLAEKRGDPVVIMTFASYVAPGYSEAAFRARKLDYTVHKNPIELWGSPANVAAGVAAHNRVIRQLHSLRPNVGFVDMEAAIPQHAAFFNDVCHLTVAGSERFADALTPVVAAAVSHR